MTPSFHKAASLIMTQFQSSRPKDAAALTVFALFEAVWSLAFLVLALLTPSRAENAMMLGLSPPRLALALLVLTAGVLPLIGCTVLLRRPGHPPVGLSARARNRWLWSSLAVILAGAMILIVYGTAAGAFPTMTIGRLAPFGAWLLGSGAMLAAALLLGMESPRTRVVAGFALMLVIGLTGILIHTRVWPASESGSSDIYFTYLEGQRLARGENPYERITASEPHENDKFATYLPSFYYLSAAVQRLGLGHFGPWVAAWRLVFLSANLVIALVIFQAFWRVGSGALGVFGSLLWLCNRWTLHVSMMGDIDFLPLSLLVVSAVILPDRPRVSLVLFGISVALKHFALVLAPIWLIYAWRHAPSWRRRLGDLLLLVSIPILTSLPLFLADANAFLRSILFSWTRDPEASGGVDSLDALIGISPGTGRIFMLGLLAIVFVAVGRKRLGLFVASMLALATVISLNSTFFTSYMVWLMPFLPLVALEALQKGAAPPGSKVPGT